MSEGVKEDSTGGVVLRTFDEPVLASGVQPRFFVGSSTGMVTMVSDEVAEHYHMGD